jgi:hypothetical protein
MKIKTNGTCIEATPEFCKKIAFETLKDMKGIQPEISPKFKGTIGQVVRSLFPDKQLRSNTWEYWYTRGYTKEEAINQVSFLQRKRSKRCWEYWVEHGYSEAEAREKVSEIQRQSITKFQLKFTSNELAKVYREGSNLCPEYWQKRGYTLEEAQEKVKEYQSNNSKKRHAKKKIDPNKYNVSMSTRIEYWLNKGYSKKEAEQKLAERQRTFTLEKCIERHGEEGKEIWEDRQERWQKTLQSRPDYDDIVVKRTKTFGKVSKESLEIFVPLYKWLRKQGYKREDIQLGLKGSSEFWLREQDTKKLYYYDFLVKPLNLIIEYHGIAFHPKSKDQENPVCFHPVEDKWNSDRRKMNLAEMNGFIVKEYWSDEENILERIKVIINRLEK